MREILADSDQEEYSSSKAEKCAVKEPEFSIGEARVNAFGEAGEQGAATQGGGKPDDAEQYVRDEVIWRKRQASSRTRL
jgi:hypothetical protein